MSGSIRFTLVSLAALSILACRAKAPSREQTLADLEGALADPDPIVQAQTAWKLSDFGREAQSAVPALLPLLKSKDATVRRHAVLALGRIAKAEDAVPALTTALTDPVVEVRRQAAMSLGEFGPEAGSAISALEKFGKEPDPCNSAGDALKKIRK